MSRSRTVTVTVTADTSRLMAALERAMYSRAVARPIGSVSEPMTPLDASVHLGVPLDVITGLVAKNRLVEVDGGLVASEHLPRYARPSAF